MKNKLANTSEKFSYLPFLRIKVKDNVSFNNNIKETSQIIKSQTYKLLDGYEPDKIRQKIRSDSISKDQYENSEVTIKKINILDLKRKLMKSNNNFMKSKKIKNNKFVSIKDRYRDLLKRYKFRGVNKHNLETTNLTNQKSNLSNSLTSNTDALIKKSFSYILTPPYSGDTKKMNTLDNDNNNTTKSNIMKIEKTLHETKINSKDIIEKIKSYNTNKKIKDPCIQLNINKSARLLKKFESFKKNKGNENNKKEKKYAKIKKINYYKLFDPINKVSNVPLKRIILNRKESKEFVWIKKSTANLILFGQSYQKLDDDSFFKQRKKILESYPLLTKDANMIKVMERDREWKKLNVGGNLRKNIKTINELMDNNLILFRKIYGKVNED